MVDPRTTATGQAPSEIRIGTVRVCSCQVRPVLSRDPARDGYLVEVGYDVVIGPASRSPAWLEIGFALGDASVVDVLPRTVLAPRQPMAALLDDRLHFVECDRPGDPEHARMPAVTPLVDVFGVGGPEVRWRHTGVRPGSHTAWMMVLVPAGTDKLTLTVTARYDLPSAEVLLLQPLARQRRLDLDLTTCQGTTGVRPVARTGRRTELVVSGAPRVLVTYARDSPGHARDVVRFGEFLGECGMDTHIDRWDHEDRQDRAMWALDNITKADFVLVVASPWCKAAGDGHGAGTADDVWLELSILRDRLMDDRVTWLSKILPVLLPGGRVEDVPSFLNPRQTGHYPVDCFTPAGAGSLLRALTRRSHYERPAVTARNVPAPG